MIQVENVTKKYGQRVAVDHLNFVVNRGEILGFLGPNGAGKSTTMNIITGYLSATEGSVKLDGHDILEEPQEVKKQIGYMPELPPLYLDMTVQDYLSFVCDIKGVPRARRKENMDKAMEMLKITDVRGRLIKNLSKGYKQRVGVAQALIGTPPVLILDEPTIGLDPQQIIETRNLIRELGQGAHDHPQLPHPPRGPGGLHRVLIINRGRIVASDTPENLSRGLVGENRLTLRVAGSREATRSTLVRGVDARGQGGGAGQRGSPARWTSWWRRARDKDIRRADLRRVRAGRDAHPDDEVAWTSPSRRSSSTSSPKRRRYLRCSRYSARAAGVLLLAHRVHVRRASSSSSPGSSSPSPTSCRRTRTTRACSASITFIFLFVVPILTMRLLSEETRQKTDQLLITSPLSITGIVRGQVPRRGRRVPHHARSSRCSTPSS